MFGSSTFRSDPFFNQNNDMMSNHMDQMMSNFHNSFGMPSMGNPSMMIQGPSTRDDASGGRMPRRSDMIGGATTAGGGGMLDMFGNMNQMFGNMDRMMSDMQNNPNAHCFSSSKVISYSNNGSSEPPKYYEASSETTRGPGGVRQTRKSERNSVTGMDRMAVGHHIYDRGHVVERSRNRRTHEREEKNDFINMDEDERDAFHREWQGKARTTGRSIGHNPSQTYGQRQQQRAIDSAEYHRSNLDRHHAHNREHDAQLDGRRVHDAQPDGRRVHINSQPLEM